MTNKTNNLPYDLDPVAAINAIPLVIPERKPRKRPRLGRPLTGRERRSRILG